MHPDSLDCTLQPLTAFLYLQIQSISTKLQSEDIARVHKYSVTQCVYIAYSIMNYIAYSIMNSYNKFGTNFNGFLSVNQLVAVLGKELIDQDQEQAGLDTEQAGLDTEQTGLDTERTDSDMEQTDPVQGKVQIVQGKVLAGLDKELTGQDREHHRRVALDKEVAAADLDMELCLVQLDMAVVVPVVEMTVLQVGLV